MRLGEIGRAGAVAARDVPPYTIVAGNPARPLRARFSPNDIATLLALSWWDWPTDAIRAALPALLAGDVAALLRAAPA